MPLIGTRGAASAQGFGEFAAPSGPATYIEDVFSTYLYTGNGSTQTITNGLDISGKGGLVWVKARSIAGSHFLHDTARPTTFALYTDATSAQSNQSTLGVTAFNSNGFSLGNGGGYNGNSYSYASWTFRKQPKFFDVLTYTGDGTTWRTLTHSLQSVPGMIVVKQTSGAGGNWFVYHISTGTGNRLFLNTTDAASANSFNWRNIGATTIDVGFNNTGETYVAYLFAHNAGGFGLTGANNVISCGSYTGNGSATGPSVSLGYEPQWLMIKNASGTGNWQIIDNMRGMPVGSADATLQANLSNAESSVDYVSPTATGFQVVSTSSEVNTNTSTYIYIAIRRGPMKTPTSGTNVYQAIYDTSSLANKVNGTVGPIDLTIQGQPDGSLPSFWMTAFDRLRGSVCLLTASTAAEASGSVFFDTNVGVRNGTWFTTGGIAYNFARAPGFFDVVCYTGTGSARTVNHNLGVAPELMIVKMRSAAGGSWYVYAQPIGAANGLALDSNIASFAATNVWNSTSPTSSVFSLGINGSVNTNGSTYVAYLFATCPGVSKVGSYSGTGGTQTISCGFAARFVMIKRTDSTGDWWVWDTARGMVAGTDPRLAFNNTAAQTNANWVYTNASGFQIVTTDASVNASGGSYIFLAVA